MGEPEPKLEAVEVELELDVYVGLKSMDQIMFWKAGTGPETRPNKYKKIARTRIPIEYFGDEKGQG